MNINFEIDLENQHQVTAMQAFFTVLATDAGVVLERTTQKTLDLAEATTEEVKPVKPKRTRKPKAEETPKEPTQEEAPKEEAPKEEAPKEEAPKEEAAENTITLEMLRDAQAPVVSANKDAIKSKLQSFNAPNLTKLDKKHYAAWMDYLKTFY